MSEVPQDPLDHVKPAFELQINPDLQGFQSIRVPSIDETLPYKPPLTVEVTSASGETSEIDAETPYAVFRDESGGELSVGVAAAGHIDKLHIKATEPGSKFDVESIDDLLQIVSEYLPADTAQAEGVSAFSVETGRSMGSEGVAGLSELLEKGLIDASDIHSLTAEKDTIRQLNLEGDLQSKQAFVDQYNETHADSKIRLQLVRGGVIVPTADAPKQPTTELFMVFGPGDDGKTMYTMAPGRFMPKMPNAAEHTSPEGVVDAEAFDESSDAWFNTVMLVGN